ncbi:MAG: chromate transporter [Clostridiales bacterium]|nr:chromate transporter [Clostridiales bacterium]
MTARRPLLTLFLRSLLISATTVGGGYVILSVLRRLYVEKLGWISEDEMLDLSAAAQSAPGAVAVNASLLVGYRLAGIGGALVSLAGTVIPPLCAMCLLAEAYRRSADFPLIMKIMAGMRAGVAAVILDTALTLTKGSLAKNTLPRAVIFAVSLALILGMGISPAWIVLGAAFLGAARGLYVLRHRKAGDAV